VDGEGGRAQTTAAPPRLRRTAQVALFWIALLVLVVGTVGGALIARDRALDDVDDRARRVAGAVSSVLEVVAAASRAVGREIPYEIVGRRPGDAPCVYADTTLATELLGWRPTRDLDDMCRDHWRWQRDNPDGFGDGSSGT